MTVYKWSQTPGSNGNSDSTINFLENQAPSSLNDSCRAMMAAIAKYRDDMNGSLLTAGTLTAYTITSNQGFTALFDGMTVVAQIHATSGASPTLVVDGLTARAIVVSSGGVAPATGALLIGSILQFTYDLANTQWVAVGQVLKTPEIASGTAMLFAQTAAPTGFTKSTTHNDKALRVVSGTASSGGSSPFSSVLASRTPSGTVGGTAIDISQMPSHNHSVSDQGNTDGTGPNGTTIGMFPMYDGSPTTLSIANYINNNGGGASHTHSWTGNAMDFAVQYVDTIIATRN